MNWDQVCFDWNQVRAFLATAEEGSFSGAARVLRSTQPTRGPQMPSRPVSSASSLITAADSSSPCSTRPPGTDHSPAAGP